MQLKLIACEIFYREMCAAVARSPNQVDVEFLPKGLHDIGAEGLVVFFWHVLSPFQIAARFRIPAAGEPNPPGAGSPGVSTGRY